ncbi:MFS transporter [Paenibacillus sp. CAA11]|uniref:MFS transporter n=1 Tax=Paenibacillus sp. CAA11 TaxID=1532905 RepID=UPI000D36EF6C|nr:MFS transporter [Paenibacillus sp. CAA11]AWB46301.1 MFS transporter [Paenibacillus sp. CAA11]
MALELLHFFINGTMVIFAAFFQLYLQDIGMDTVEIGWLLAAGPLISLLAHPFWKYWTDRKQSAKPVLLLMLAGLLVSSYLLFSVSTYRMLYWFLILFYFFQVSLLAQNNTFTLDYTSAKGQGFRKFRIWGSIGWAVTALAAGPLIDLTQPCGLSALLIPLILLALGACALIPAQRREVGTPWLHARELIAVVRNKYFMTFLLLGLLVAIPNTMNGMFMPIFMLDLGGSKLYVGLAVFLSTIFEAAVFVLLRRFLRRKLTHLLACLTLVSLLFALRWYLMSIATEPLQIILIQLLHSVTFGGFFYVGSQLTGLFLPRPYRSSGQAVYALFWSGLSGVFAGLLGGWLFLNFGGITLYKICLMFTLCGLIGFGVMWYHLHRHGYSPLRSYEN